MEQLDELAKSVVPLSYDVRDWAKLGFCDGLVAVENADEPTAKDGATVRQAVAEAIARARSGPSDLSTRLDSPAAATMRAASRTVRDTLGQQWAAAP